MPSSPHLVFVAGFIFWTILLVAIGEALCSRDLLCPELVEGTSSGDTEGREACASTAGSQHFLRSAADVMGTGA